MRKGSYRIGVVDYSPILQWFWTEDWESGTHIWWVEATEASKHPVVCEPVPNCPDPSICNSEVKKAYPMSIFEKLSQACGGHLCSWHSGDEGRRVRIELQ